MLSEKSLDLLKEGSKDFGLALSPEQLEKLSTYAKLLVEWNEKINLTAITDEEGIAIKHFLDSFSLYPLIPKNVISVIDVGTGAGFPGIPLKIAGEKLKVTLLDSLEKRVKFLNEVCTQLGLKDIHPVHGRAEDFGVDKKHREQYDLAVARAVASLPVLLEYCLPFVKVGGYFMAMKGPDAKEELIQSGKALDVLGGELVEAKTFSLPHTDYERCIVIIKKCRHTPANYPRKSGKPSKQPII
jgi:16S rRNA (guanine527-N7)-methyltransferase